MKIDLEKVLLIVFFALMMWVGIGTFWSHTLDHDYPYGYSAADSYQHHVRAEWIKQQGNYATEAPHIVTGYDNVIGYYMPGSSHIAVIFSHLTGLESYDALYFMVFFVAVLSAFIMYYGMKSYNVHVAMLSLPITTLVFAKTFYIGILLGQWPFTFGTLFLVGSFWSLTKLKVKNSTLLVALFVSAVALTHTSELVFVVGLVGVAFLFSLINKDWKQSKSLIAAGVITLVVSMYYLIIFTFTWGKQFGYHFYVEHINMGFPNVRIFQDFQVWMIVIMMIGMVGIYYRNALVSILLGALAAGAIALFNTPSKITSDVLAVAIYVGFILLFVYVLWKKKPEFAKVLAPYMLIIGYASFIGFGPRAFQTRFMWPITLAPLFGLGVYQIILLAKNFGKIKWTTVYTAILTVVLTVIVLNLNYTPLSSTGTMYNERWQMFNWLQENGDTKDEVLFLYGDGYDQTSMLYHSGMVNYLINMEDYIDGLNKQTIKREYYPSRNMDYGPGIPYRKGLFDFGYNLHDPAFPQPDKDVCRFDYYVIDKVTARQQMTPLIQYNLIIRETFLQNGMEEAYSNAAVSVLKNNNPRGDCIGQQETA